MHPFYHHLHGFIHTVPSIPQDVRAFSSVVVWGPPAEPNGVIVGYEVRFSSGTRFRPPVSKAPFESYHVVTGSDISGLGQTISVQVT